MSPARKRSLEVLDELLGHLVVELGDASVEVLELRTVVGQAGLLEEIPDPAPNKHLLLAQLHLGVLVVDFQQHLGSRRVPVAGLEEHGEELVQQEGHLGEEQVAPDSPALEELEEVDEGLADLDEELMGEPGGDVAAQVHVDDGRLVVRGQGPGRHIPVAGISVKTT